MSFSCCFKTSSKKVSSVVPHGQNGKKKRAADEKQRKEKHQSNLHIVEKLKEVPLFLTTPLADIKELAAKFHLRNYVTNEDVMCLGDAGDEFFIINKGTADVLLVKNGEEQIITDLKALDYFGEQALLTGSVRSATVRATSDLEVLVLARFQFQEQFGEVNFFPHRRAVCADDKMSGLQASAPEMNESLSEEEAAFIKQAIAQNILFSEHSEELIDAVVPYFVAREYTVGDIIIEEGDVNAAEFFVISEGICKVRKESQGDNYIAELPAGTCFGELALMYNSPRNATIVVGSERCVVFVMKRHTYRFHLINTQKAHDESEHGFLRSVKLFSSLLNSEISLIEMAMVSVKYEPDTVIFSQGDEAENGKFYIIKEGTLNGLAQKENEEEELFVLGTGQFFGDLALLGNEPRKATITVAEGGCTLLEMTSQDFQELLGPLKATLERNAEEYKKPVNERSLIGDNNQICDFTELVQIGLLGRGAFGKVTLVVDPHTKRSYALKAIKKTQIEELGQAAHIVNEKKVMVMLDNRFLVNLRKTFKDAWRVYFLVDVCLGGELFTILRKKRSFSEPWTQFYAGCVIEAFEYMHSLDVIYRDLKPENLVMDSNGYIKFTDFGFAKVVPKKTYTLCGTPDYLPPEIVTGQGHGKGVDWWCLGVLIYELLSSFPPFFDDEPMGTYRKIIQGKFKFPKYFSAEARDLIARLLRTKPTKRLAVMKGGADNIRNHLWYQSANFDWVSLKEGTLPAPFNPEVKSYKDISNFDQRDKRASDPMVGRPPKTPWDVEF